MHCVRMSFSFKEVPSRWHLINNEWVRHLSHQSVPSIQLYPSMYVNVHVQHIFVPFSVTPLTRLTSESMAIGWLMYRKVSAVWDLNPPSLSFVAVSTRWTWMPRKGEGMEWPIAAADKVVWCTWHVVPHLSGEVRKRGVKDSSHEELRCTK